MGQQISNIYEFKVKIKLVVGILLTFTGLIMFLSFFISGNEKGQIGVLTWSIIFVILGIWYLKVWYFNTGRKIELNNNGLIFHDKKTKILIKWEDIEELYELPVCRKKTLNLLQLLSKDIEYTFITKDKTTLMIDNKIKNYKDLVKIIQDNIYELIYSKTNNLYNEYKDIQFGDLLINKKGIKNKNDSISWNDVKNVETKLGIIYVNKKGKLMTWGRTDLSKVSNYFVKISIINQILKGEIST